MQTLDHWVVGWFALRPRKTSMRCSGQLLRGGLTEVVGRFALRPLSCSPTRVVGGPPSGPTPGRWNNRKVAIPTGPLLPDEGVWQWRVVAAVRFVLGCRGEVPQRSHQAGDGRSGKVSHWRIHHPFVSLRPPHGGATPKPNGVFLGPKMSLIEWHTGQGQLHGAVAVAESGLTRGVSGHI